MTPLRRIASHLAAVIVLVATAEADAAPCNGQPGVNHLNYQGTKRKQEQGGFVANGAYVAAGAYVGAKAEVCDSATVESGTRVYGSARIGGEAVITGSAAVYGNAVVRENAVVRGKAKVSGNAIVSGDAVVEGNAIVRGYARIREGVVDGGIHSPKEPASERLERERLEAANAAARAEADARTKRDSLTREVARMLGTGAFDFGPKKTDISGDDWREHGQDSSVTYEAPCRIRVSTRYSDHRWKRREVKQWVNPTTFKFVKKSEVLDGERRKQKGPVDFATNVTQVYTSNAPGKDSRITIRLREATVEEESTKKFGFTPDDSKSTRWVKRVMIETPYTSPHDFRRAGELLQELLEACKTK